MSSESDVEMQSALPKNTKKKMPKSPSVELLKKHQEPKKISTKDMIREALTELNTRKGVSLYAIKKFITERHNVNTEKINYLIKKSLKSETENGSIIQTKGIGASGSFRLAPKKKPEKKEIKKKVEKKIEKKLEKPDKPKKAKKEEKEKVKKDEKKVTKKKVEVTKSSKAVNKKEKTEKDGAAGPKKKAAKMAKEKQTPAKKRTAMMKRKSIGSIIKPPKMKPKART